MTVSLTGIALAWFARRKSGFSRILRYLVIGLHLAFLVTAVAFFSNERIHEEPAIEKAPMSEEDERAFIDKCATSDDPLCGL